MNKLKFIIIDRLTRARDNGEYFYRFLMEKHPEIEIKFGLHPASHDWARLKADHFDLIDLSNGDEIKQAIEGCTHFLFSETNEGYKEVTKFLKRTDAIFIYLNHGCFFARGNRCYPVQKFDYMICGNSREFESVLFNAEKENLPPEQYLLTGLPRMDEQVKKYNKTKTKNLIVIQPWWRNNLTGWKTVENTNKLDDKKLAKLLDSEFVKGYNKLLNSPIFKDICRKHNLQVVFKRHPVMENIPGVFKVPDWIIDEPQEAFIDLFAKTKVYITDYSSNAFETANLGIPCIYYEPDYHNLVVDCNRPEWAWNVKEDGLGPAAFNLNDFLIIFYSLILSNFELDPVYQARRKNQITFFRDTNNCKRCLEAILAVTNNKKPDTVTYQKNVTKTNKTNAFGQSDTYLYF